MARTTPEAPRVGIYARFSSKLQKPTSIEDQIRLCRQRAEANGAVVVRVRVDRSTTATTRHSRPGLRDLLLDAEHGAIDCIYSEALDRISRDQEDMPGIYKRLKYWDVDLFTLEEGAIQPIHICVGGLMNHAFIDALANKTRRGQIGAVHAGRSPGGLSYGYSIVDLRDDAGRPIRGLRKIHAHQADVVRRIYRLYAGGASPREIAGALNADGEPGPSGRGWTQNTINGNRTRRNGILNNELYRGKLIYNRQQFVRNPDTGKRQARPVPESDWIVKDVPELRIVDDDMWNIVQNRRHAGQDRRLCASPKTPLPLTGILRCAVCGGPMTIINKRRYACHAHREKRTCSNPRGIYAAEVENQACGLLAQYIAKHHDLSSLIHDAAAASHARRQTLATEIASREERIRNLIDSIETGRASHAAHRRVLQLEQEIATLELDLRTLPEAPAATPESVASRFLRRLANLNAEINDRKTSPQARNAALIALARLIERIDLSPLPRRGEVHLEIHPRTDALVAFALSCDPRQDAANRETAP